MVFLMLICAVSGKITSFVRSYYHYSFKIKEINTFAMPTIKLNISKALSIFLRNPKKKDRKSSSPFLANEVTNILNCNLAYFQCGPLVLPKLPGRFKPLYMKPCWSNNQKLSPLRH